MHIHCIFVDEDRFVRGVESLLVVCLSKFLEDRVWRRKATAGVVGRLFIAWCARRKTLSG